MRRSGILKTWNDERGFGFIEPTGGGNDVFVHIKAFPPGIGRPIVGQSVTFAIEPGPNGKTRAHSVQISQARRERLKLRAELPARWTWPRLLVIPAFAILWLVVAFHRPVHPGVSLLYIGLSIVTFHLYAVDKTAAKNKRRRTPENTLHLLSLAGGWPGALLAQQLMRHKCAKSSFVRVFWITVAVNIAVFVACFVACFVAWHAGPLSRPWPT